MPSIDLATIAQTSRTGYPPQYAALVEGRWVRRVGAAADLKDFGVSHVVLKPGAASSQRHWHEEEDEFVVVLSGEAVLIEEDHRTIMRAGDMAAFPKGHANGHHLVNEGEQDCVLIAVGRVSAGDCHYPGIDRMVSGGRYCHTDGTPY